jgi:ABC-type dipeptide/oligopeptide/nickel transport system permease subunit
MSSTTVDLPVAVRRSRPRRFLRRFPMSARLAALLLFAYVLIAVTGPLWTPYDPFEAGTGLPFSGASRSHLFGTDILGRDVFSRVVVLVYAPRIARMARSVAVDLVTRDFVTVARARGEPVRSIVWRELTPNGAGVLLVEFGVRAGYAPILISSLGFLGFGARPPSPEWGLMISENRAGLFTAPLIVLAPCAALALLVISLNLVTDGIARALGRSVERTP